VFAEVVEEAGHRYEEWSLAWGTPLRGRSTSTER
jgi:hypothetical protein